MIQLTHNQYRDFCKAEVSNAWRRILDNNENTSSVWSDFERKTRSVSVLSYEFDGMQLNDSQKRYINGYFAEDEVTESFHRFRGLSDIEDAERLSRKLDLKMFIDFDALAIWKNDKTRMTLVYCEGDIILDYHYSDLSYYENLETARELYKVN